MQLMRMIIINTYTFINVIIKINVRLINSFL